MRNVFPLHTFVYKHNYNRISYLTQICWIENRIPSVGLRPPLVVSYGIPSGADTIHSAIFQRIKNRSGQDARTILKPGQCFKKQHKIRRQPATEILRWWRQVGRMVQVMASIPASQRLVDNSRSPRWTWSKRFWRRHQFKHLQHTDELMPERKSNHLHRASSRIRRPWSKQATPYPLWQILQTKASVPKEVCWDNATRTWDKHEHSHWQIWEDMWANGKLRI